MKKFLNKNIWCLVLLIGGFGLLAISYDFNFLNLAGSLNNGLVLYATNDIIDAGEFGMAIFMEAFCSIHMSVFVLMPLSQIFFKDNHKKAFITMFAIRAVFLLTFNFITTYIAIVDFLLVFLGAFVVVPVSAFTTGATINRRSNQVIDKDNQLDDTLELKVVNNAGISNLDVLKKALVMQYADINRAFYARDINKIKKLCSPGVYMDYKTKWEMYDKVLEIPKIEDVDFFEVEFGSIEKYNSETFVDLYIKYTCLDYSIDTNNNIVRGNRNDYKMFS